MWQLAISAAVGKAIGALIAIGSFLIILQLLPYMLSWMPEFQMQTVAGQTEWTFNLLNPLSNALNFAPVGVHYLISYWYLDLALTLGITGMLWGLVLKIVTK